MPHSYQPELQFRFLQPSQREPREAHVALYVAEYRLDVYRALLPEPSAFFRAKHLACPFLEGSQLLVDLQRPPVLALGILYALLTAGAALAFVAVILAVGSEKAEVAACLPRPDKAQRTAFRARVSVAFLVMGPVGGSERVVSPFLVLDLTVELVVLHIGVDMLTLQIRVVNHPGFCRQLRFSILSTLAPIFSRSIKHLFYLHRCFPIIKFSDV